MTVIILIAIAVIILCIFTLESSDDFNEKHISTNKFKNIANKFKNIANKFKNIASDTSDASECCDNCDMQDGSENESSDRFAIAYAILAVFGSSIGLHNFYIRKYGLAIIDILFCWTGIPALVGFIKGAVRLFRLKDIYELV